MTAKQLYFEWLCDLATEGMDRRLKKNYLLLLNELHSHTFYWSMILDKNREIDGLDMRKRFVLDYPETVVDPSFYEGDCTVLEMMVGLAYRCENSITIDMDIGEQTGRWFWLFISSMGLLDMTNYHFDHDECHAIIERLLEREYGPDGDGGLFFIPNFDGDMTKLEIWYQLHCYLNYID